MSDGSNAKGLRERPASGTEDRLGRALADLLENPVERGAGRASDAREKAVQAQELARAPEPALLGRHRTAHPPAALGLPAAGGDRGRGRPSASLAASVEPAWPRSMSAAGALPQARRPGVAGEVQARHRQTEAQGGQTPRILTGFGWDGDGWVGVGGCPIRMVCSDRYTPSKIKYPRPHPAPPRLSRSAARRPPGGPSPPRRRAASRRRSAGARPGRHR